jgi:sporulation protein YlmC with PRC-barrel domain
MASEYIRYRSDLLGTQVITRDGGKRLGVVSQLWVDIDRKEVVAIGLRESMLSGVLSNMQQVMPLSEIRQIGDVILVDDNLMFEDPSLAESYNNLINCEVVTELGEPLGRVRGFKFDVATGELQSLIIAAVGYPQIPDQVVSTYELPIEEVVSGGADRLIVFEGAEDKMVQLTVGIFERLGISGAPWEREGVEDYMMPTPPSNQLGTGLKTPAPPPREATPIPQETWKEEEYAEPLPRWEPEPVERRQAEPAYVEPMYAEPEYYQPQEYPPPEYQPQEYPAEEESNWSEESNWDDTPAAPAQEKGSYAEDYKEVTEDVWGDTEAEPYNPPPVNLPEKKRVVEYEEETDY